MKSYCFLALALFIGQELHAKSLGVLGQTFPVAEKSLLVLIYERLNSMQQQGQWEGIERKWVNQVESHVMRPKPLGLARTDKKIIHYYTPIATVNQDVVDATGRIILNKGMSINALTQMPSYRPVWVFINYDDEAQRKFADSIRSKFSDIQWILTGGTIGDAEKQINQTIYFDQEGRISKKLKIKHVPALVTRSQDSLKVVEYAIGENGHAF